MHRPSDREVNWRSPTQGGSQPVLVGESHPVLVGESNPVLVGESHHVGLFEKYTVGISRLAKFFVWNYV